ncbi:signal peptidase I [Salinigranum salinum]|uniref:signal peptidase I n=1 Tax=Salinigranum salinum TaxID=1364937 RepID=UPI00126093E4|nr:signal peptidase I [Salinigranum salinum]
MTPKFTRSTVLNTLGVVLLIALVAPFAMYAAPQTIGATESYVVMSGSMEPAIQTGDVIFVYDRDPSTIEEGDVITYNLDGQRTEVTTHRVVDIVENEEGQRVFVTKGDANEDPDPYRVPSDAVIGVMPTDGIPARVPFLGHALLFAQSKLGIALLVFVPAGLLVITELWDLYKHATSGGDDGTEETDAEPTDDQQEQIDDSVPSDSSATAGAGDDD